MHMTMDIHGREVEVKTGTYGPAHDPYAYCEYGFIHKGRRYTFHEGISVWIREDDVTVVIPWSLDITEQEYRKLTYDRFKTLTGLNMEEVEAELERRLYNTDFECEYCEE